MSSNIRNNFFMESRVRHWKGLPRAGVGSPSRRDLTALGDVGYGGLGSAGRMVGLDGPRDFCGSLGLLLSHLHLPDPHSLSHLSFSTRFFKLHERKCEPIIMTVPRKVSTALGPGFGESSCLPELLTDPCLLPCSLTSSRMTCTQTQPAQKQLWKQRSGLRGRTLILSSSP